MSRAISLILVVAFAGITSLFPSHKATAKLSSPSKSKHTSKLSPAMNVRVELTSPAPKETGDEYDLVGIVSSGKAVKSVTLKWDLGKVASLVAGAMTQTVDLEPGKELRMNIKVKALQLGASQVRLTASVGPADAHLSTSGRLRKSPIIITTESSSGKKSTAPLPGQEEKKPKIFE